MRAVEVSNEGQVDVRDVARPQIRSDDVLIVPAACGICGTDRHIAEGDFPGSKYPVIPGHEFSGYVAGSGPDGADLSDGTFVAIDPNVVCGFCRWCTTGRPNLCDSLVAIGVGRPVPLPNSWPFRAEMFIAYRKRYLRSEAALIEPLACVLNAIDASEGIKDRGVMVTGAGTMGLLIAIVAGQAGAHVTVVDPSEFKLNAARELGADATVTPQALDGERFDVVFEASGAPAAVRQALRHLHKRGRLVQVGVLGTAEHVDFNPFDLYERELSIVGSNSLVGNFSEAADVMVDIASLANRLITHQFPVWDYERAIASTMQPNAIKTHLTFS